MYIISKEKPGKKNKSNGTYYILRYFVYTCHVHKKESNTHNKKKETEKNKRRE